MSVALQSGTKWTAAMLARMVEPALEIDVPNKFGPIEFPGEGALDELDSSRLVAPTEGDGFDLLPFIRADDFHDSVLWSSQVASLRKRYCGCPATQKPEQSVHVRVESIVPSSSGVAIEPRHHLRARCIMTILLSGGVR